MRTNFMEFNHGILLAAIVLLTSSCGDTQSDNDVTSDAFSEISQDISFSDSTDQDPGLRDAARDEMTSDAQAEIISDSVTLDSSNDIPADNGVYWSDQPFEKQYIGFDRTNFSPVNGWILLDYDLEKILADIETAATYEVNHIQLSHNIIMNVDQLLAENDDVNQRANLINQAVIAAHEYGMKVYLWSHEFQDGDIVVCYGPDGEIWETRSNAYRQAIAKVPDIDGIILMFGSAGISPWYTLCDCDWCSAEFPDEFATPPQDVRIQLIVEHIAGVLNELGKKLIVRVFAHQPDENPWHADGLARARDVNFTTMHKSDVGDWQPYNPHDPTLGQVGAHPSILEMDAAGEYFGRSEIPFAAPIYYRYRLKHAYADTGIGAVARISRNSDSALGTPNEINLQTIMKYVQDPSVSIDQIWTSFVQHRYFPTTVRTPEEPPSGDVQALIEILKLSFPVMRKTHYVLGLWALEKSSDIPVSATTDQFGDRGNMPKWDTDWTDIWNLVKSADVETVLDIFSEATEGVMLADDALTSFRNRQWNLSETDRTDLDKKFNHMYLASRTWRAVKTYIYAKKSSILHPATADTVLPWADWARDELEVVATAMDDAGLSNVSIASPSRIRLFVSNTTDTPDTDPTEPPDSGRRPLYFRDTDSDSVTIEFDACISGSYSIEYGKEFPHFDQLHEVETVDMRSLGCQTYSTTIEGLARDTRYIFRLKIAGDETRHGGDFWEMTDNL